MQQQHQSVLREYSLVFKLDFKMSIEEQDLIWDGRLFQSLGAATDNSRLYLVWAPQ